MTDNTEKYYSFGKSGRTSDLAASFHPLLDALDNHNGWNWDKYDVNNDGQLDGLIILHSGYAAEEGGKDCTNGRGSDDRIWSHAFAESNENPWTSKNGKVRVQGYMISSGLDLLCGSDIAKMGVMTHEYLHTFNLIDLYDLNFVGRGIGNFDIMSYPYGKGHDGYIPVPLSAWSKGQWMVYLWLA
jgi:M6 family metalloprotease-like protein